MTQCEECGYGDGVHAPDCWLAPGKRYATCGGCGAPLSDLGALRTCETGGCPGNLHGRIPQPVTQPVTVVTSPGTEHEQVWRMPLDADSEPVEEPVTAQTEADRLLAEVRMAGIALHAAQDRLSSAQQALRGYLAQQQAERPSDQATEAQTESQGES
jgi:hypothetical protein